MATMNPYADLPAPHRLRVHSTSESLARRSEELRRSPSMAPVSQKPLRPTKERLPVATIVDPEVVLPGPVAELHAQSPASATPDTPPSGAAAIVTSFDGGGDTKISIPPDTAGAVSGTHVFNPLNDMVYVYDRTGNEQERLSLDAFWQAFHPGVSTFDPRVVFDPFEQRFYFASMADATQPTSSLLMAVSENSDPTGEWHTVRVPVNDAEQGEVWLDYPSVGFSGDKITVQVNLFSRAGNAFRGSTVYVFDKETFFQPPQDPLLAMFVVTDMGGTQVPATTYDPGVDDQLLVSRWTGDAEGRGFLQILQVSGSVADETASLTRIGFVAGTRSWESFSPGDLGPQQGTSDRISCGDDRLLSVVLAEGSLWCSHAVFAPMGVPTRSLAQWWEIHGPAWSLTQTGVVEDTTGGEHYAHPTLSVNREGGVVMGMSRFSGTSFASCVFTYRRHSDPPGTMTGPDLIKAGENTYHKTFTGTSNRWGDYSATQVDPDGESFWTIQEYASSQADVWATRWAHITLPP